MQRQIPTKKLASTALKRLRSMSAPATADLVTMFRLWHAANICFSLLPHCRPPCCREPKVALCTGSTPCKFACRATSFTLSLL